MTGTEFGRLKYALQAQVHVRTEKASYPESVQKRVMEMYVEDGNLRRIARQLKIAPQTVAY